MLLFDRAERPLVDEGPHRSAPANLERKEVRVVRKRVTSTSGLIPGSSLRTASARPARPRPAAAAQATAPGTSSPAGQSVKTPEEDVFGSPLWVTEPTFENYTELFEGGVGITSTRSRTVEGFIPTGDIPTGVALTSSCGRLEPARPAECTHTGRPAPPTGPV